MGLMDSAMQSDAEFTADTDQGAEDALYTFGADATSVIARVIVRRFDPQYDEGFSQTATREFEVWIPYSSDYGLTSKPLPGDKIALQDDPGDAGTTTKAFSKILEADAGGWLVRFV